MNPETDNTPPKEKGSSDSSISISINFQASNVKLSEEFKEELLNLFQIKTLEYWEALVQNASFISATRKEPLPYFIFDREVSWIEAPRIIYRDLDISTRALTSDRNFDSEKFLEGTADNKKPVVRRLEFEECKEEDCEEDKNRIVRKIVCKEDGAN